MNLASLWQEIEEEQAWRTEEMRFFQNQLGVLAEEAQRDQFRRAMTLLLYAHFEGFCRYALLHYAKAVNAEALPCSDAAYAIVASSLANVFGALRDPASKCDLFRNKAPDDQGIHRFHRDREFVQRITEAMATPVAIPDAAVNTESNLKPAVLRKNLYRLGFAHDQFAEIEGQLDRLVNIRNDIAHGSRKNGVLAGEYDELFAAAMRVMNAIKNGVMSALREGKYLRPEAGGIPTS